MKRNILLLLVTLVLPSSMAEAHAELTRAIPEPGAIVDPVVNEIRLTFDVPLAQGSPITLFAEGFQVAPGIRDQLDGVDMYARIPAALGLGLCRIQWAAVGEDGHSIEGSYQFRVPKGLARRSWVWWLAIALPAGGAYVLRRRARRPGGIIAQAGQRLPALPCPARLTLNRARVVCAGCALGM